MNRIRPIRRSFLTLVEMLIALVMISLIGGLFMFNLVKAYQQQRFNIEVGLVLDDLRLAQDLMLITPGDFYVKLKPENGGFSLAIETDASLTAGWKKELERSKKLLKSIKYAKLEERTPTYDHSGEIDIKFFSNGSIMSEGLLRLGANVKGSGSLTSTICLSGFPAPIMSQFDVKGEITCKVMENEPYLNSLSSNTIDQIRAMDDLVKQTAGTEKKSDQDKKTGQDKKGDQDKKSDQDKKGGNDTKK